MSGVLPLGAGLDVAYLASLSTDSLPALGQAFLSPSLPAGTREAAGAALACRKYVNSNAPDADWRNFTLSRSRGRTVLKPLQASLKQYQPKTDSWPWFITSPNGNEFDCSGSTSGD